MLSNFLQPRILFPSRIVDNAKCSLVDNIFTNIIENDTISGNIIDKITDHMPNFLLLQNNKKDKLKNSKIQIRNFSNFDSFVNLRMQKLMSHLKAI